MVKLENIGKEKNWSKSNQFSKKEIEVPFFFFFLNFYQFPPLKCKFKCRKEIYKPCCIAILSTQVYAHTICTTVSLNHKRGKNNRKAKSCKKTQKKK